MSRQIRVEPVARATSARPSSSTPRKIRPSSSNTYLRKQLIQNTYAGTPKNVRVFSSKTVPIRQLSTVMDGDKGKKEAKIVKPKEEMMEQIFSLKLKVNELSREVGQQRGKTQEMRKRHNKCAKVLSIEFENQRLWNAGIVSTHKVEGMRNMYDRIKEQNEMLKDKFDRLSKSLKVTKELEYIKYIEVLQIQLRSALQRFQQIAQNSLHLISNQKTQEGQAKMNLIGETQYQYEHLHQRHNQLKTKFQMASENLKDRNKKITFLDRHSKDLENKMRDLQKQLIKKDRELNRLQQEYRILKQDFESSATDSNSEISLLKAQLQQTRKQTTAETTTLIAEKDGRIAMLVKDNNYYQQMIKQLRKTNTEISRECQQIKKKGNNDKVVKQFIGAFGSAFMQEQSSKSAVVEDQPELPPPVSGTQTHKVRQTAEKFRQSAIKKRRVQHSQICEITELLRLRFIGLGIELDKLTSLLNYKPDPSLSQGDNSWNKEHISMKQIRKLLNGEPFGLEDERAELLARYLAEDVAQQFVYVDQGNQNYRSIAKSILHNLFGNYSVIQNNQALEQQIKLFLERYNTNLQSVLASIEPGGTIQKKRFIDTLNSLGAEYSDQLADALLGIMAINADSLLALHYPLLFQKYSTQ